MSAADAGSWWQQHPRMAAWRLVSRVVGSPFPPDFDEADRALCGRVAPYTMTSPERVYALIRAVEHLVGQRVPGAIVECGVWRGGSMMAAALTLLRLGDTSRELCLFDTFSGMTEPGVEDRRHSGEAASALLERAGSSSDLWGIASLEDVREAVLGVGYPEEQVRFVQGPVEETVPEHAPAEIALLRLDTDWYASTKHELEHLYPRLARHGVLIVDDYGYWQGARQAVDEYIDEYDLPLLLNRIDETGRIAVKP